MAVFRTVLQLREELQDMTPGASIQGSKVLNILGRAFARMYPNIYPRTLLREVNTTNPFATDLRRYIAPSDAINIVEVKKGEYIYTLRSMRDLFRDKFSREYKLEYVNGVPVIEIDDPYYSTSGTHVSIHPMETLAGVSTADLISLQLDKVNAVDGFGITFDLDKTINTGTLAVIGLNADISSIDEQGSLYMFVRMPQSKYIDSITLTITNATNSQIITVTGTQVATVFQDGVNLVRFPLDLNQGAITTSPITGYTLQFQYNSIGDTLTNNIQGIVIDNFYASNTEDVTIKYQSDSPFHNSSQGFLSYPVSENDVIHLENDAYSILLHEAGWIRTQGIQAEDGIFNNRYFKESLHGATRQPGMYSLYAAQHPDEVPMQTNQYYSKVRKKY